MTPFLACFRKDLAEIRRGKRALLFSGLLLGVSLLVLLSARLFPALLALLVERAPELVADGSQLGGLMARLFPQSARESLGIWASDAVLFLTLACCFLLSGLLPGEIRSGRWVFALQAGYRPRTLIAAKILAYGGCTALPTLVFYLLYYNLARLLLADNFAPGPALLNALALAFAIFSLASLSLSLSLLCRSRLWAALGLAAAVLAAPDILSLFAFGRFFPTHLLTFAYTASTRAGELLVPGLALAALQGVLAWLAIRKTEAALAPERRPAHAGCPERP